MFAPGKLGSRIRSGDSSRKRMLAKIELDVPFKVFFKGRGQSETLPHWLQAVIAALGLVLSGNRSISSSREAFGLFWRIVSVD